MSKFQCPTCGCWADESSLVSRTEPEDNPRKAEDFGGTPLDWTEKHRCPYDNTEFEFTNSNC